MSQDYAILADSPNQKYTDFEQVRVYLQNKMNETAQSPKGITADPVVVKIFVKEGVNISLIDMPGLSKISPQGKSSDVPTLIEEINRTLIQNPNNILLAISPANVDVVNSDALRLANELGPQGQCTIGVFTKTDLIEDSNTIRKAFEEKPPRSSSGTTAWSAATKRTSTPACRFRRLCKTSKVLQSQWHVHRLSGLLRHRELDA